MNQAEEDALAFELLDKINCYEEETYHCLIRVIRATVAAERERCAKVCEEHAPQSFTVDGIITRAMCAAAIRRGE